MEDFPEIILPYADTYFDQDVEKVGTVCFYWHRICTSAQDPKIAPLDLTLVPSPWAFSFLPYSAKRLKTESGGDLFDDVTAHSRIEV